MQEGLRAYIRSPAAVGCTLGGVVAVGAVVAAAAGVGAAVWASGVTDNPIFLGGLGHLAYLLLGLVALAGAGVLWLPFGAGVAYAVGRQVRGERASPGETAAAVLDAGDLLYRWVRTRAAVGPLAEHVLGDDDVRPAEVAVGCTAYVVPAAVLDAGTLPQAVERANRVTPQPGRERVQLVSLTLTALVALAVLSAPAVGSTGSVASIASLGSVGAVDTATALVAGAVAVVGAVFTAALDTAWRAGVYASQDLSEGFTT